MDLQEEEELFKSLQTRASAYAREEKTELESPVSTAKKQSKRNSSFIKCKVHNPKTKKNDIWTKDNSECSSCLLICPRSSFPNGVLPTRKSILQLLVSVKQSKAVQGAGSSKESASWLVSKDIALHWIFCNVYPQKPGVIQRDVDSLEKEYNYLRYYVNSKKGTEYWGRFQSFIDTINMVPDFIASTDSRRRIQEKLWNCVMIDKDRLFHKQQIQNPPFGYCTSFEDKKWRRSENRKEKRNNRSRSEHYEFFRESIDTEDGSEELNEDPSFDIVENSPAKKTRYQYDESASVIDNDDMPNQYRNVRTGPRSIRPEVYTLMAKLKSKYHMSQVQAEAAIVETGNSLFGRRWKTFNPELPTDRDTLPASSNMRRVEPYLEAVAMSSIVNEIMDGNKTVVYANDGSAKNGVGSFLVQSLSIDGVQRPLPTFSIFTETRESLEELEVMTIRMLVAASGYRYSEQDILRKIDFVMHDSTSHNLKVINNVCERFNVEAPKSLLCNIHPLMMFQRQVKDVFQSVHDTLGKDRIVECFLVDVDFANEDFISKAIKCLTSFINKDFSAKPWNRQSHFDSFIAPKINESFSYKEQRFNRLFQCCMVLVYHIDDIANYLDTYRNIINGISILDRSFVEMTLLKPIFCAVALIGIHITFPFELLLVSKETNYSTLTVCFPVLYDEIKNTDPESLCTTETQVFHFVSSDLFQTAIGKIKEGVLNSINDTIQMHKKEIVNLLRLILPKCAKGFSTQKGKIFGFGDDKDEATTTFKVCNATDEEMEKLNLASVHNLSEERSVGHINFELGIRGHRNLEASSKKLVLNKSFDLIDKSGSLEKFRKFRSAANDIKLLKVEWNQKMKRLEAEGNLKRDLDNNHSESVKYKDLEFLKQHDGPFTTAEEVKEFNRKTPEGEEKNKRLYIEVRYAKNTCLSLKHTASVFRLKENHKKLTTDQYAQNLCHYLSDARDKATLTANDLSRALDNLVGNAEPAVPVCDKDSIPHGYKLDEHIASVWLDEKENTLKWFLGVVTAVSVEAVDVVYYIRKDKDGSMWTLPDELEAHSVTTCIDQVIAGDLCVGYAPTRAGVRVSIDKHLMNKICSNFNEYINQN